MVTPDLTTDSTETISFQDSILFQITVNLYTVIMDRHNEPTKQENFTEVLLSFDHFLITRLIMFDSRGRKLFEKGFEE